MYQLTGTEMKSEEDIVREESQCAFCGCLLTTADKCKEFACELCRLEYQDAFDKDSDDT